MDKREVAVSTSAFDKLQRKDGRWSARDLHDLMAYSSWQMFETPLHRAMKAAENQGLDVEEVFNRSSKNPGDQGGRPGEDYLLTRTAAYLVAMNGDPNKPEVAAAQYYFTMKTQEAETTTKTESQELSFFGMSSKQAFAAARLIERNETLERQQFRWTGRTLGFDIIPANDAALMLGFVPGGGRGRADRQLFLWLEKIEWVERAEDGGWAPTVVAAENDWLFAEPMSFSPGRRLERVFSYTTRLTSLGVAELRRKMALELEE